MLPSGDGIIPDNMVETDEMLAQTKYFVEDKTNNTLTYYFYYNKAVAAPTEECRAAYSVQ